MPSATQPRFLAFRGSWQSTENLEVQVVVTLMLRTISKSLNKSLSFSSCFFFFFNIENRFDKLCGFLQILYHYFLIMVNVTSFTSIPLLKSTLFKHPTKFSESRGEWTLPLDGRACLKAVRKLSLCLSLYLKTYPSYVTTKISMCDTKTSPQTINENREPKGIHQT